MELIDSPGGRLAVLPHDGPPLGSVDDVVALIGDLYGADADHLVVPVSRLPPAFFDLSTRLAGEIAQKLANYRLGLVVLGDVAPYVAASTSFRDLVRESARGGSLWFEPDLPAVRARLGTTGPVAPA